MALKRIGQVLIDLGLIDEGQLAAMLEEQTTRGGELIGKVGLSLGFYSEDQLGEALAEQFGTAAEFGDACAFLCSEQAGYITAQNLLLDGGLFPGIL